MKNYIVHAIFGFSLITIFSFAINNGFNSSGDVNATVLSANNIANDQNSINKRNEHLGVKKSINGGLEVNLLEENKFSVNGISIIINQHTKYRNGRLSASANGSDVKVKGYFVRDEMMVASSIEFIADHNDEMSKGDMQPIALLLLLKHKYQNLKEEKFI